MEVDGDPVGSPVQAVHSPDPVGRSVEVHTADMAGDMPRVSAGLGDVSQKPSRYEACRVVWCAHIAATGSSTSSDEIALAPEGGPWRSFYRNAVIGRKPFFDLVFLSPCFFQLRRTFRMRPRKRSGQPHGKRRGTRCLRCRLWGLLVSCYLYIVPPVWMDDWDRYITLISLPMHVLDLFMSKQGI